jgi:succinate dehydrogenase / fumarate reductase flavoprotein subunit
MSSSVAFALEGAPRYDVLVVGAGGAGLRAAVAAAEEGAKVAVLSKSLLGKSQTVMGAALAAAMGSEAGAGRAADSWGAHFADTMEGGRRVNQWGMAQALAREAPDRVRELERWGAAFGRSVDGGIRLGEGSGHGRARLVRAGQHTTGLELLRVLQQRAAALRIDLYCEHTVVHLLRQEKRAVGAVSFRRDTGAPAAFLAKAVVLATGGCGKAYTFTSNFYDSTGDGLALALDAGADLIDMEFVQFHPTGMVAPASARGLLVAESIRNLGGVLLNSRGERFMFRYVPEGYRGKIADTEREADAWYERPAGRMPPELLPRDDVSRAIDSEIRAGRGLAQGGVLLDIASRRPAELIRRRLSHMYRQFLDLADVDITARPMEVAPTCHYMMGGIRVDAETCASTVPGLYAAGEAAGGLHGANRLNGNGISELLVFGRRAGLGAAAYAKEVNGPVHPDREEAEAADAKARAPLLRTKGENPYALQRSLQALMQKEAGIVRSDASLGRALAGIAELRERARDTAAPGGAAANPGWQCALDVGSLLATAEAIVRSAHLRRETRGAHVREEYPQPQADLEELNTVTRCVRGAWSVSTEARTAMPARLRVLLEDEEQASALA